jgi:hypothetical protein
MALDPETARRQGRTIDDRPFLRDAQGRFPVLQDTGFYVSQTAINLRTGDPVDPDLFAYAALSAKLRDMGDVDLGDFGLAIRASTGAASPFVYADAGGDKSNSLGECSTRLISSLFGGGRANAERVCHIVFPQSRSAHTFAQPELAATAVRRLISRLRTFENADEFGLHLAMPPTATALPQTPAERLALSQSMGSDLHRIAIALGDWGHQVASREAFYAPPVAPPANKQMF